MRPFRYLVLATAAVLGGFLTPAPAFAHAFHAEVKVADVVTVLAYFDGDEPAQSGDVVVTDADGTVIASGKTDERGVWTFPKPRPGTYTVRVESMGHVVKREFLVDGNPEAPPVVYTGWRPNKPVALASGLGLLLGTSAVSWFLLRRRRVK